MVRLNVCKHFNGVQNDECDAGVRYSDVKDKPFALPCLPSRIRKCRTVCPNREYPTQEEVDAYEADVERVFRCILKEECPDCGAKLRKEENRHHVYLICDTCEKTVSRGRKSRG